MTFDDPKTIFLHGGYLRSSVAMNGKDRNGLKLDKIDQLGGILLFFFNIMK